MNDPHATSERAHLSERARLPYEINRIFSGRLPLKLFLAILLSSASLVHAADAEIRWNSNFKETYESRAEGSNVSFAVRTPPQVDRMEAYPLLIALSGGLRAAPSERFPFFLANPTRTRIWGYRAISTYDAMQVVALMKDKYPIDPDRVYLTGSSAGNVRRCHG